MEKKISFGFSSKLKKPNLIVQSKPVEEKPDVQLIEYVEEKSIKIIGEEEKEITPLVIPMRQPNKKLVNLVGIVEQKFDIGIAPEPETKQQTEINNPGETKHLSLDELAARELLNNKNNTSDTNENNTIEIPTVEKPSFEGETESSLADYETIPIESFGKAMLRGMGWKDGEGIGKNKQLINVAQPLIRPKGMGLGADKMTRPSTNEKQASNEHGEPLACVKGAFVKILAGQYKYNYGQIIGLDDESGRFIIKLSIQNLNVSINEFLVQPVTKNEFEKNSKILNNAKYREYVKKENDTRSSSSEADGEQKLSTSEDESHKRRHKKKKKHRKHSSDNSDSEYYKRKSRDKYKSDKYRKSHHKKRDK